MTAVGPAAARPDDPARAASGEGDAVRAGANSSPVPALGPRKAVGANLQSTLDELSRPGRGSAKVPHPPADALDGVPAEMLRAAPLALPELNEPEVIRHFV